MAKFASKTVTNQKLQTNSDYVGDDEVSEMPIETSDAEDEESDDSPIVRQADSKKFSDDSEEDWEKEDVYQLASDVDSVQDVVTVIQGEHDNDTILCNFQNKFTINIHRLS